MAAKWIEIKNIECSYSFKRELIDNVKRGQLPQDVVDYQGEKYYVVDGHYGHCNSYPNGFRVKLKKLFTN